MNDIEKFNNKLVTQIITFKGGYKTTFRGIKPETIEHGKFTHFKTEDGRMILVNPENVFCIEVF